VKKVDGRRPDAKCLLVLAALGAGCGGAPPLPLATTAAPVEAPSAPSAPALLAEPTVTVTGPERANVGGALVTFDGTPEGLAWPALQKAYAARGAGQRAIISVPRSARVIDVLRVVWTLRDNGVEIQTLGAENQLRAIVLEARPSKRAEGPTCHAAVFVAPGGALRVAHPGGSTRVADLDTLLVSLDRSRRSCPIRWVAFGGETPEMPWGWVFDVAVAVDTSRAAQGARFVLGEQAGKKP
jgi:hypothetical protein